MVYKVQKKEEGKEDKNSNFVLIILIVGVTSIFGIKIMKKITAEKPENLIEEYMNHIESIDKNIIFIREWLC